MELFQFKVPYGGLSPGFVGRIAAEVSDVKLCAIWTDPVEEPAVGTFVETLAVDRVDCRSEPGLERT